MNGHAAPLGGELWNRPYRAMATLGAIGIACMLWRYMQGLGATTGLNDGHPCAIHTLDVEGREIATAKVL